ncbi:MAG: hypothetical protein ACRD22_00620 [Terriglobia bacterium]
MKIDEYATEQTLIFAAAYPIAAEDFRKCMDDKFIGSEPTAADLLFIYRQGYFQGRLDKIKEQQLDRRAICEPN